MAKVAHIAFMFASKNIVEVNAVLSELKLGNIIDACEPICALIVLEVFVLKDWLEVTKCVELVRITIPIAL
jgi:hypothetical protein